MPTSMKSAAARRFERQRAEAAAALAAKRAAKPAADRHALGFAEPLPAPKPATHPLGCWPIGDLQEAQCRFACTPHAARAEEHRFCGAPATWLKGKPTSWCAEHLPVVCGAPGRSAGGTSVADLAATEPTGGSR